VEKVEKIELLEFRLCDTSLKTHVPLFDFTGISKFGLGYEPLASGILPLVPLVLQKQPDEFAWMQAVCNSFLAASFNTSMDSKQSQVMSQGSHAFIHS